MNERSNLSPTLSTTDAPGDAEPNPGASPEPNAADPQQLKELAQRHDQLRAAIEQRIVGQAEVVDRLLTCLFAGGHALFVGVPGLAKTLLVQSLAEALDLAFSRIQFTPDLMPADVTGSEILEQDEQNGRRSFRFVKGPVFCNLLLADEINRTPPKTQAALLQAMQEGRVTAGGQTHPLPQPFHVFATQNPIEQEGTYALPEAQLDRFMMQIRVAYPSRDEERRIVSLGLDEAPALQAILTPAELGQFQALVRKLPIPPSVVDRAVDIVRASRPEEDSCPSQLRALLRWGAGPRAGQQLLRAGQARAALRGGAAVTRDDIDTLAPPVLEHRLVPSFAAQSQGLTGHDLVLRLLDALG